MRPGLIFSAFLLISCTTPQPGPITGSAHPGKEIAFNRNKGNCLACHEIEEGEFPGNLGPPLKAISSRFKTKAQLREQIWDATRFNPETSMPPFGRNKILTEKEIDQVVDYLWAL